MPCCLSELTTLSKQNKVMSYACAPIRDEQYFNLNLMKVVGLFAYVLLIR